MAQVRLRPPSRSLKPCTYPPRTQDRSPRSPGGFLFAGTERQTGEVMISLTDNAANKVKQIQQNEGLEAQGLRLRVIGGGCSGFSYDLFFDDQINDDIDEQFSSHGIPLYVDMMSFTYLDGTEIDYV